MISFQQFSFSNLKRQGRFSPPHPHFFFSLYQFSPSKKINLPFQNPKEDQRQENTKNPNLSNSAAPFSLSISHLLKYHFLTILSKNHRPNQNNSTISSSLQFRAVARISRSVFSSSPNFTTCEVSNSFTLFAFPYISNNIYIHIMIDCMLNSRQGSFLYIWVVEY